MLRGFVVILFIVFCRLIGHAQMDQIWLYYYPEFKENSESNLYFRLENNNFVINNEYFGEFIEGYTKIGYSAQPSFIYYAGSRLRLKAGLHAVQYSGVDEFTSILPTFSIHTKLTPNLDLIMGGLRGDVHHRLIEPLFNPDNQYDRPIENGFQFIYNSPRFWMDTWVDWEQMIFHGDKKPEKFTAGISSEYTFSKPLSIWKVSVPFQFLATHVGGQISDYEESMQTLANIATGAKLSYKVGDGFIREIGLVAYLATYQDATNKTGWNFSSGGALYRVAEIKYKYGIFLVGHWNASNFIAPKGSPIFQSTAVYTDPQSYYKKDREMITSKLSFTRTFMKQIKFSAMVQIYYDLPAGQFDYSYGLNMVFTPNFFITKAKFN